MDASTAYSLVPAAHVAIAPTLAPPNQPRATSAAARIATTAGADTQA